MSGVTPDLIGAALGHTTSRMAELVYGRIGPADLDRLITERNPGLSLSGVTSPVMGGLLMGGDMAETGGSGVVTENPESSKNPEKPSAQGRNRTADTGIFNPRGVSEKCGEYANNDTSWAANGLSFGARARRWLMRGAA
jgi:hypothetical protein